MQPSAAAPLHSELAPAPRAVPASFVLAELLPFRWWYIFALFLVAVAPISLWVSVPAAVAPVAVAALALVYAFQIRSARARLALLKWGHVATVTGSEVVSRGTYYSGTTWYNVYLPVAKGWTVRRDRWSGPNTKTRISYVLDGYRGQITVNGRAYVDGVVLADQRRPQRALCVTAFAYDLDRDESGNWTGGLRPRLKVGMAVWSLLVIGWLVVAVAAATGFAADLASVDISPGGTARVSGNSTAKTVHCNDGHLTVTGNSNTVTVDGHCAGLKVAGNSNTVTVDSADTITLSGNGNRVTYHSGSPKIVSGGISNGATSG